jgi:thiamine biosynthesis lipoprotein
MMADGWATALLALGSTKGIEIAEKNKIASLFIIKEKNNFIKIKSSEFKKLSESNN